jgi:anti-sigma factor RsiW
MNPCPDETELVLYAAGELPAAQEESLKAHLAACEACRHEAAAIARGLAALARLDPGPALSAGALERLNQRLGQAEAERRAVRAPAAILRRLRPAAPAGPFSWALAAAAVLVLGILVWTAVPPAALLPTEYAAGDGLLEAEVALELLKATDHHAPSPLLALEEQALDEIEVLMDVLSAEQDGRS